MDLPGAEDGQHISGGTALTAEPEGRTGDPPTFDLQSHSLHSDGALAPAAVVAAAAQAGVELLALTDHDSVDGVQEAASEARRRGIRLVTGVEISTLDRGTQDLHILGYRFDEQDAALRDRLDGYREDRRQRALAMADALHELGFELEDGVLRARAKTGKSIGRPHLAEAVVAHPANAERLRREGFDEPSAFLEAYLIEGRPAFRPRAAPSVAEAITAIHAAGGVAVWAHPFWDVSDPDTVRSTIERFREAGIDGVECFYVTHTRAETELAVRTCAEHGLLRTGSSDFHGPRHREFSRFRAFNTYGLVPELGPLDS